MSGLVSLLLFAAFFYLMMRFGCGSHMVHGHGSHDGSNDREMHGRHDMAGAKVKDPVCGMEVEAGQGYSEIYEGRQYRFCSRKCLDQFDADPHHFAPGGPPPGVQAEHHAFH
jgi:YHS domain-containing protein